MTENPLDDCVDDFICQSCNVGGATLFCIPCDAPLCQDCAVETTVRHRAHIDNKSQLVPISHRPPRCIHHTSKPLSLFCEPCQVTCCELCLGNHSKHEVRALNVAAGSARDKVGAAMKDVTDALYSNFSAQFEGVIFKAAEVFCKVKSAGDSVRSHLEGLKDETMRLFDIQISQVNDSVSQFASSQEKEVGDFQKDVLFAREKMQDALVNAQAQSSFAQTPDHDMVLMDKPLLIAIQDAHLALERLKYEPSNPEPSFQLNNDAAGAVRNAVSNFVQVGAAKVVVPNSTVSSDSIPVLAEIRPEVGGALWLNWSLPQTSAISDSKASEAKATWFEVQYDLNRSSTLLSKTPRWTVVYEGYLREFRIDNLGFGEHRFRVRSCPSVIFSGFSNVCACVVTPPPEPIVPVESKKETSKEQDVKHTTSVSVSGLVTMFKKKIGDLRALLRSEFGFRMKRQSDMQTPSSGYGPSDEMFVTFMLSLLSDPEPVLESLRRLRNVVAFKNSAALLDFHIYCEDAAASDAFCTVSCAGDVFPLPANDSTTEELNKTVTTLYASVGMYLTINAKSNAKFFANAIDFAARVENARLLTRVATLLVSDTKESNGLIERLTSEKVLQAANASLANWGNVDRLQLCVDCAYVGAPLANRVRKPVNPCANVDQLVALFGA